MHFLGIDTSESRGGFRAQEVTALKRGYVVDCTDLDGATKKLQVAAFLRTDGEGDVEMDISVMGGRKKRKVPVMI
jgi:hypothetical protein